MRDSNPLGAFARAPSERYIRSRESKSLEPFITQLLSHRCQRTRQMAAYGSGRRADHLRALVKRVAVVVMERDHRPLPSRQTPKDPVKVGVRLLLDPAIGVCVIGHPEPWQNSPAHIDG